MTPRWRVALSGSVLMACLGTVYAWSLFAQPLAAAFGWSSTVTTGAFSLAIAALGVGAVAGGRWQDRVGPRRVALTGVLLWAAGNLLAGLGMARLGAPWLYATYGLAGGFGIGLAYVTPVAAVAKWFPTRRGLGTGVVVMGFGLGAFFYAHALRALPPFAAAAREAAELATLRAAGQGTRLSPSATEAVLQVFVGSGLVFALIGGLAASLVRNPATPTATPIATATPTPAATPDLSPSAALRTRRFWILCAMLFLNVTAGILVISNAVPIIRELTGATPAAASALYGTLAVANGLGRFLWGAVSDRTGRPVAYALVFGTQAAAFLALGSLHGGTAPVAAALVVVLLGYGGGFGTMPAFVADLFGTRHLGALFGWILLAWSAGGLVGPLFVATVKDATGAYAGALPFVAVVLALAAALLPRLARRPP